MRSLHILFVDSDTNAHERLVQALGSGFDVQCVATITEARQFLKTQLPDIIISEVWVNGESGLELCHTIRNTPSLQHLPIMLLTSLNTLQDKIAGFDAGTDDYVIKPFDARHLMARIRLLSRIKRIEKNDAL